MISDVQQYQIHSGDRDAFKALFGEYGKSVYVTAVQSLQRESAARAVVKQTFFRLQNELVAAPGPIDIEKRLQALTSEEIARAAEALQQAQPAARTWPQEEVPPQQPTPQQGQPTPQEAPTPQEVPWENSQDRLPEDPRAGVGYGPNFAPKRHFDRERRSGWILLVVFVVLLALTLAWLVAGILMDLGVVPYVPLGYAWFNEHIYPFFWTLH